MLSDGILPGQISGDEGFVDDCYRLAARTVTIIEETSLLQRESHHAEVFQTYCLCPCIEEGVSSRVRMVLDGEGRNRPGASRRKCGRESRFLDFMRGK